MNRGRVYFYVGSLITLVSTIITLDGTKILDILLVPGWLFLAVFFVGNMILANLAKRALKFAEWVIYSVGLSVISLITTGMVINQVGIFSSNATLKTVPIVLSLDLVILLLSIVTILRHRINNLLPQIEILNWQSGLVILISLMLPFLSAGGAMRLNNGASASMSIGVYLAIALLIVVIITFKKTWNDKVFSAFLWGAGSAILLSVSMRSNHLMGYDIHQELQVFSATLNAGIWKPHTLDNTYYACLSITVLPTLFQHLLQISPEYVYKFAMQLIFGFVPVAVYLIGQRIVPAQIRSAKVYAFLAAIFFMIQYQFLNIFTSLVRQQIATLFFALIFVALTSQELNRRARTFLVVVFALGMIVSHYSTAYVCLALLMMTLIIRTVLAYIIRKPKKIKEARIGHDWNVSARLLIILFLITFGWYAEIIGSTGGIAQKLTNSLSGLGSVFSSDSRSPFVNATFGIKEQSSNPQSTLDELSNARSTYKAYEPKYIEAANVSPIAVPTITPESSAASLLLKTINKYIPSIIKLLVLIGAISVLFACLRAKRYLQDGALVIASGIIFVSLIVFPSLSQEYNLERLYQQLLVFLSPLIIVGILSLRKVLHKNLVLPVMTVVLLAYFACTSGLVSQLYFKQSNINFSNNNLNFLHFYATDSDISSQRWLQSTYYKKPDLINMDKYASLNTQGYLTLPDRTVIPGLLPSQIFRSAYVYESSINKNQNIVFDIYKTRQLTYTFPSKFVNNNKNVIYANGTNNVYK